MSYMGLFWETGMPEAWALSRNSGDRPEDDLADGSRLDLDTMALLWPQNTLDAGASPVIPGQTAAVPWAIADLSAPTPDGKKTKKTDDSDSTGG